MVGMHCSIGYPVPANKTSENFTCLQLHIKKQTHYFINYQPPVTKRTSLMYLAL